MNSLAPILLPARQSSFPMLVDVISSIRMMRGLEQEWTALAQRSDCRASAGYAWALAGWMHVAAPRGAELRVITVRDGGKLVGVWPLVRYTDRHASRIRPLGSESSEYTELLIAPEANSTAVARLIWQAAETLGDALQLPYVRPGSPLAHLIQTCHHPMTRDAIAAPWVSFDTHPNFSDYRDGVNKRRREAIARNGRRLARQGRVEIRQEDNLAARAVLLDWILDQKTAWLRRTGLASDWLGRPEYRAFLHQLAAIAGDASPLRLVALLVSGQPVAGFVFSADDSWLEFFIIAHDPAWESFSPGSQLLERCLGWSHATARNFDFRIGDERYKSSWANQTCNVTSHHIALTRRGLLPVATEAMRLERCRLRGRYRRARAWAIDTLIKPWLRPQRAEA